jgi:hypothetical protein
MLPLFASDSDGYYRCRRRAAVVGQVAGEERLEALGGAAVGCACNTLGVGPPSPRATRAAQRVEHPLE